MRGLGVPKDNHEAFKWFKLAAEQGHAPAQFNLGLFYRKGLDVTKDDAEALKWLKLAAEQGLALAQFNLGLMYNNGLLSLRADNTEACKWYRLAAEQGHQPAKDELVLLDSQNSRIAQYHLAMTSKNAEKIVLLLKEDNHYLEMFMAIDLEWFFHSDPPLTFLDPNSFLPFLNNVISLLQAPQDKRLLNTLLLKLCLFKDRNPSPDITPYEQALPEYFTSLQLVACDPLSQKECESLLENIIHLWYKFSNIEDEKEMITAHAATFIRRLTHYFLASEMEISQNALIKNSTMIILQAAYPDERVELSPTEFDYATLTQLLGLCGPNNKWPFKKLCETLDLPLKLSPSAEQSQPSTQSKKQPYIRVESNNTADNSQTSTSSEETHAKKARSDEPNPQRMFTPGK